jgi:hypothetical protein
VARVTVMAMTHGLARGRHVSWNESVAAADSAFDPFLGPLAAGRSGKLAFGSGASSE